LRDELLSFRFLTRAKREHLTTFLPVRIGKQHSHDGEITSNNCSFPTSLVDIPFNMLPESIKKEFPIFADESLVYLDTAASAQKPACVLERMDEFQRSTYSNVHRGVYGLSQRASEEYEKVRGVVASFIGAANENEIVFTHGTTESLNLVAQSYCGKFLTSGDEILLTIAEHHSNIVPWQLAAERQGLTIKYSGLDASGAISLDDFSAKLSDRTRLVSFALISNVLGVEAPVSEMVRLARSRGAAVVIDAAQVVPHKRLQVSNLGADFVAFSSHKLYGPTGVGVLWGRKELLEAMPPFMGGGDMIRSVSIDGTVFNDVPIKFEAGTPPIVEVIGLGAAVEFVSSVGLGEIEAHERELTNSLEKGLRGLDGINVLGPANAHRSLVSFAAEWAHPHDLAQFLDSRRICVRAGHHCAQPLMKALGVQSSTRASVGMYNTGSDISACLNALEEAKRFFS
jgi:cysteine desulfurase / selenocysteine lyase